MTQQPVSADFSQFVTSRREELSSSLLSSADLLALRARIDQVWEGSSYCDGCGMCCTEEVPLTELEFHRIEALIAADPALFRPRGYVCPFLDFDADRFNRNLRRYGLRHEPLESLGCTIYSERPMLCRLYPAPHRDRCREYNTTKLPPIIETLQAADGEDYPELLIQKYYLTLRWERTTLSIDTLEAEVELCLVPGWLLDRQQRTLSCFEGPHWIKRYEVIPDDFPIPNVCAVQDWALDVVERLERPVSAAELVESFAAAVGPTRLGALVARLELYNAVVPVDIGRRMREGFRGLWSWRRTS